MIHYRNLSTGESLRASLEKRRAKVISSPGVRVDSTTHGHVVHVARNPRTSFASVSRSFDFAQTGPLTIRIKRGYCGFKTTPDYEIAQVDITVAASFVVYIRCNLITGAFDTPTSAASLPSDTAVYTYYPIVEGTVSGGAITSLFDRRGDIYESGV